MRHLAMLVAAAAIGFAGTAFSHEMQFGVASNYGRGDGYAGMCVAEQRADRRGCKRLDVSALTAAHRSWPFGSQVRVTNKRNGRSVVVRINDRGPFVRGRVIDLTPAAADLIGCPGLCPVTIERIS